MKFVLVAGLAALALGAGAAAAPLSPTEEERPWAPWLEPEAPFFTAVLDARKAGPGFPADNLTPRGLILNLGHDTWACFDPDLLRVSAVWSGGAVSMVELAPISYHRPDQTNFVPEIMLPAPIGKVWLANGIYPGWQSGTAASAADPRTPGPTLEEVGRGPMAREQGRFDGLSLTAAGAVLRYTVAGTSVREWMTAREKSGALWIERHFAVEPADRPLLLVLAARRAQSAGGPDLAVAVSGGGAGLVDDAHLWVVRLPAHAAPVQFTAAIAAGGGSIPEAAGPWPAAVSAPPSRRWPQEVATRGTLAESKKAYVVDDIALPLDNPWKRNVRIADIQFFRDGSAAAVTVDGDVWKIDGLRGDLTAVRWRRFASGLHEPLSLAIRDDQIFVFDRQGIWRLRDTRGTGEADDYELFSDAFSQTAAVRDHACSIKVAPDGTFVIAKGGSMDATLSKDAGKILRVSADGKTATTLSWGFRMPFIGVNPRTGAVTASDQQGFYVPSTPVYLVEKNEYHGFLDDFRPAEVYPAPIADPLLWIPHPVNPSSISQVWLEGSRMGPLDGALLSLGYNRPEIFRVTLDRRHAKTQGSVVSVTSDFSFAPLNAAVDPADGQLYVAGFRIYGSSGEHVAGLARVRYTGRPVLLPRDVVGMDQGVLLRFDVAIDPRLAADPANYVAGRWNYKRTHNYGSAHYKLNGSPGQDRMVASSAYLSHDGKSVFIGFSDMKAGVSQMHVGWSVKTADGEIMADDTYFTPYALAHFDPEAEGFGPIAVDLTPRSAPAPAPAKPVTAQEGERLAGFIGCLACHTSNGTVGTAHLAPSWRGLYGSHVTLNDDSVVVADDTYIRNHILKRTAKWVKGFENAMPNYSGIVTDDQVSSLILYIRTLR